MVVTITSSTRVRSMSASSWAHTSVALPLIKGASHWLNSSRSVAENS
jgi:hypothetical protein